MSRFWWANAEIVKFNIAPPPPPFRPLPPSLGFLQTVQGHKSDEVFRLRNRRRSFRYIPNCGVRIFRTNKPNFAGCVNRFPWMFCHYLQWTRGSTIHTHLKRHASRSIGIPVILLVSCVWAEGTFSRTSSFKCRIESIRTRSEMNRKNEWGNLMHACVSDHETNQLHLQK